MAMNGELLVTAKLRAATILRRERRGGGLAAFNARMKKAFEAEDAQYHEHLRNGWAWIWPIPSLGYLHPTKGYRSI